ncbi:MAG: methylenetetrahydrofolate reductase [NAD(P)H] [Bacteroidetes bacterium HGW-Bacteroidetes-21]|jgi:methylenetetrahydrofolate reductase (NADPH)|nr:MAG: methylenetetrahydrofolate reductase [NAD(P)H] [Bacteroidetes bacterium HGW-Bacteroidetes-21]
MKVPDILNSTKKTLVSFEILPPLKGHSIESIYKALDPLMEFKPPYINVTYHQEEAVYKKHASGLLEKRIIRKRPGTVAISAALQYKFGVEVVPHIICGGFTKEETENALIELNFLGIHNLLAIRGDADKNTRMFVPEEHGHPHALGLVKQITDLNKGIYLDEEIENKTRSSFSVGVAGYPEKHMEAPNMASDLDFLKQKIEAGAEYIVTQMFYENKHYFNFVKRCRDAGIQVPIIPGIKPISIANHLNIIPKTFHVEIPEALEKEIKQCANNDAVRQVGTEWAIMQSKELINAGVPVIHYYTMGKSDNIENICKNIF